MKTKDMKRNAVTVHLTDRQHSSLKKAAKEVDMTQNDFMRYLIDQYNELFCKKDSVHLTLKKGFEVEYPNGEIGWVNVDIEGEKE